MNEEMKVVITPNESGEVVVRTGEAKELYEFKGTAFRTESVESFVRLVQAKANRPQCVVFCDGKGFKAILDDTVTDRPFDTVSHPFELSTIAQEWERILQNGAVFNIKSLVDFLKRREPGEITDIDELIYGVQNFRYLTNIAGDFTFADRNNYVFSVKIEEAESTIKIPKTVIARIELLKNSGHISDVEIEIEVKRPTNAGENPGILLLCPKYDRYLETAKAAALDKVVKALDGFLVVDGSPS